MRPLAIALLLAGLLAAPAVTATATLDSDASYPCSLTDVRCVWNHNEGIVEDNTPFINWDSIHPCIRQPFEPWCWM